MNLSLLRWKTFCLLAWTAPVFAQALPPSLEQATQTLQGATVTVRISPNPASVKSKDRQVTVCSGVAVGKNRVIVPWETGWNSRIRVTLPGGRQADAKPEVLDEYTGLALIALEEAAALKSLKLRETSPAAGSWALSAAAWGAEPAVASFGVISGVDRKLPSPIYPPLLQCDLRTTVTSSGAGLVNAQGELLGVIVSVDQQKQQNGWTYAIPAKHVARMLQKLQENRHRPLPIVLKRRRPSVGMTLDGGPQKIRVARLQKDGPAERAGVQVGDYVTAVNGAEIRSVYQFVRTVLYLQPGDKLQMRVARGDSQEHDIEVTLGGKAELAAVVQASPDQLPPKLEIFERNGEYLLRNGPQNAAQPLMAPPLKNRLQPPAADAKEKPTATDAQKIQLLEKATYRYIQVIALLKGRLEKQQQQRQELEGQVEALKRELRNRDK